MIGIFNFMNLRATNIHSVYNLKEWGNKIHYTKCHEQTKLDFKPFPIASSENSTYAHPLIPETFILSINNGRIYSPIGLAIIDNNYLIEELI